MPQVGGEQHDRERNHLSTAPLHKMSNKLGIKIEQLDILDRVYYPMGLVNLESDQEAIRGLFADIARGSRALPVLVFQPQSAPPGQGKSE